MSESGVQPAGGMPDPAGSAPAACCAPGELIDLLARELDAPRSGKAVLLVVSLNRSDRLDALARCASAAPVLDEVARRIESVLRPADCYAIASCDEAWILLRELPSEALAELASHSLIEALSRPVIGMASGAPARARLRPAIGGAWAPAGSTPDPMTLLAAASDAAERSRRREDPVRIVRVNDDHPSGLRRHEVERDLHEALAWNELDVYYQPQVELRSGLCKSAEALIRWRRADGRMVEPSTIASICEERGLIGQLTRFTLNTALRHLSEWQSSGFDLALAINLSAITLADTTLPIIVSQALDTWGVRPDRLVLELTESALIRNERTAIELARQLRDLGCRLSIDDFGTGYSSLRYLEQFPLDELKIDRSFVSELHERRGDRRVVRALVDLAHAFGLRTVAEGVESASTEAAMRELDCDLAQGFHLSPALPADEFERWFVNRNAIARLNAPESSAGSSAESNAIR